MKKLQDLLKEADATPGRVYTRKEIIEHYLSYDDYHRRIPRSHMSSSFAPTSRVPWATKYGYLLAHFKRLSKNTYRRWNHYDFVEALAWVEKLPSSYKGRYEAYKALDPYYRKYYYSIQQKLYKEAGLDIIFD